MTIQNSILSSIISIAFLAVLFSTDVNGQQPLAGQPDQQSAIHYAVDLTDARNHYVTVTATVPVEEETTELMMAVWTPGSYFLREYARHIDKMQVRADGKNLKFEKTKKNRWLVQTANVKSFQVKYRIYCNEMSVRTNWVGRQYAMLNGAPTYLAVPDRLDNSFVVQLKMPSSWTRSATSLRSTGDVPHTFVADDFDELVDSPIVAGNVNVYPFTAGGVEHQLVNVGESGYWDGSKAAADLKKVVEEHQKMWANIPYERYLFLNMIVEGRGGLEHDNSTVLMTSRWSFRDESKYKSWLGLASHEFFHTWNVRRLRPKTLVTYDYENEVYTDSLWIAEGITSYYENLALIRAGLLTRDEFLEKLSGDVESVQSTSGRQLQSLKDSSFDAWIKFYRPDDNSSNTRISYYSKGAVVAFLLDTKIRKLTDGKKSLDDVMRAMFDTYHESGYISDDFRKTVSDVAGVDLSGWFSQTIDSTNELNYSEVEVLGIEVPNNAAPNKKPKKSNTDSKKEKPSKDDQSKNPESEENPKPWLGFESSADKGRVTVSKLQSDSPASDVGLNLKDEIIAIDGFRVGSSIDSQIAQYDIGDEIELLIARRGKLTTLQMTIGSRKKEDWELQFVDEPSESQVRQLDRWLGEVQDDSSESE